jgi:hypothetical protein
MATRKLLTFGSKKSLFRAMTKNQSPGRNSLASICSINFNMVNKNEIHTSVGVLDKSSLVDSWDFSSAPNIAEGGREEAASSMLNKERICSLDCNFEEDDDGG